MGEIFILIVEALPTTELRNTFHGNLLRGSEIVTTKKGRQKICEKFLMFGELRLGLRLQRRHFKGPQF